MNNVKTNINNNSNTNPWIFSTSDYPDDKKTSAWFDAMHRLRMPLVTPLNDAPMNGTAVVTVSPMGLLFARVEADAMEISGKSDEEIGGGLWLSILLEGKGILRVGGQESTYGPGTIICGITASPAKMTLNTNFKQLFVNLPRFMIAPRLLAKPSEPLLMFDASKGFPAVFRGLLENIASQIEILNSEHFGAIEHAVIEFLATTLATSGGSMARGGAKGARASLLNRILQRMEILLDSPDLTINSLAEDVGITPRYFRRLLSEQGINFVSLLKKRRLERCREDMVSPLFSQLGITEIAFRRGFNDAAYFSRSFKEQYGISPREYRKTSLQEMA